MDCIIVSQDYKNAYHLIQKVQLEMELQTFSPKDDEGLFWIGGSGGSPETYEPKHSVSQTRGWKSRKQSITQLDCRICRLA